MVDQPWQCGRRCDCPGPEADGRCPKCRVPPERGVLCIGGPKDGQRLHLPEWGCYVCDHIRLPPGARYGLTGPFEVETTTIYYDRTTLDLGGAKVDVLALRGMGTVEVLAKLLEGYRPNPE